MKYAVLVIFIAAWIVAVAAWIVGVWNMLRIPRNLRPGVEPWARGNPLNHALFPDALTEAGLAARRRVLVSVGVFIGSVLTIALLYMVTKWFP